jgi:hypothetical protein
VHVLKAEDTAKQLWRETHFGGEDGQEAPIAEACLPRNLADRHPQAGRSEAFERERDDGVSSEGRLKPRHQRALQELKTLLVRRGVA